MDKDKEVFSSNRGRLLCVSWRDRVKVSAFRFTPEHDLEIETTWETEVRDYWKVLAARECIDRRTGDRYLFLLTDSACAGRVNSKRVKLFRVMWMNSVISRAPCAAPVKLVGDGTFLEIPSYDTDLQVTNISLLYGPSVMCVSGNEIILCDLHGRPMMMNKCVKYELNEGIADKYADITTSLLASESDQNWTVAVVLQRLPVVTDGRSPWIRVTIFSLEKDEGDEEFRKDLLDTRQFIPQEYASKIVCFYFLSCKRISESKETGRQQQGSWSYRNSCVIGLNDGYVLAFDNGCMKLCVPIIENLEVFLQSPAAVDQVDFIRHADVLICHTNDRNCFVINYRTSEVLHQWQNVAKQCVADFLQRGHQQLLLLFNGWSSQRSHSDFLLTDFQGLTVDRRPVQTDDSFHSQAKDAAVSSSESMQHAFRALQAQNQAFMRAVAEEEQRLRTKHTFLAETWKRLQSLSLEQPMGVQRPEVPLVPLLGTQPKERFSGRFHGDDPCIQQSVGMKVFSPWHKIMDNTCVVGVQVLNTSARELHNLNLVLSSPASSSPAVPQTSLSASSKTWQCHHLSSETSLADKADTLLETETYSRAKRQRINQAHIQQTDVVRPTDTVTVTCCFPCPSFAHLPQREYCVHLCVTDSSQSEKQQFSDKGMVISAPGDGGDRRDVQREATKSGTKFVSCGRIVLRVSEVLQQNSDKLWNTLSSEDMPDSQFEEAVLTIHAMQNCWKLGICFVLHEASILPSCMQRAGLVYLPRLGQYICSHKSSPCLSFVRVELVKTTHLRSRETRVLVFARDTDQLMLFLQHLYSHLPADTTITAASIDRTDANIQNLTTALASEIKVVRQQSRAALQAHRNVHSEQSQTGHGVVQQHETSDTGPVPCQISGKQTVSRHGDSVLSEVEEFAERQRKFQQSHKEVIREDHSRDLRTAIEQSSSQTDETVAEVYGKACFG